MDKNDKQFDFSGWATKYGIKCGDGRTIEHNAFADQNGEKVPLVWNHQHGDVKNVLGNVILEHRDEGEYAYGTFNDTEDGQFAKRLVLHGDIDSMSICANKLRENKQTGSVFHGIIREVSLVLAGSNPGAYIDTIVAHSDDNEGEAIIYSGEEISLFHSDDTNKEIKEKPEVKEEPNKEDENLGDLERGDDPNKTVQDVIDTMTEEQQNVMYALLDQIAKGTFNDTENDTENDEKKGDDNMKHNVFDNETQEDTLMHSEDIQAAINEAKRYGSMKDAFLAHGLEDAPVLMHSGDYGIDNVGYLLPDAKAMTNQPIFIQRDMSWVNKVMSGVHHTPFSRIKSVFADITEDDARAKGYMKGKLKKEEVFSLLKRTTTPTTIYKKQKMDRDDVTDITDIDVISWLKSEMRMMLDEEIARAILIGDGRLASSDDKINEQNIRPVLSDEELFTITYKVGTVTNEDMADAAVRARKNYKGSGNPTMFTTEDQLTDMLLKKDTQGYRLYKTVEELAAAMRVSAIVTVPVMEGLKKTFGSDTNAEVLAIIVNLNDYNVGADKGGAINMFDDFDIDYNQQKYLIETRCSGALTVPYSAIVLYKVAA